MPLVITKRSIMKFKPGNFVRIIKGCGCRYWTKEDDRMPCSRAFGEKVCMITQVNVRGEKPYQLHTKHRDHCSFQEDQLELTKVTQYDRLSFASIKNAYGIT